MRRAPVPSVAEPTRALNSGIDGCREVLGRAPTPATKVRTRLRHHRAGIARRAVQRVSSTALPPHLLSSRNALESALAERDRTAARPLPRRNTDIESSACYPESSSSAASSATKALSACDRCDQNRPIGLLRSSYRDRLRPSNSPSRSGTFCSRVVANPLRVKLANSGCHDPTEGTNA